MKRTIKGMKANEMIFNGEEVKVIDYVTDKNGWTCEVTCTILQYNGKNYKIDNDRHGRRILKEI